MLVCISDCDGEIMSSYNQDVILEAIRGHPGCTMADISTYTGIHRETLNRPLRSLGKAKMVRYETIDFHGKRRYWVIP